MDNSQQFEGVYTDTDLLALEDAITFGKPYTKDDLTEISGWERNGE